MNTTLLNITNTINGMIERDGSVKIDSRNALKTLKNNGLDTNTLYREYPEYHVNVALDFLAKCGKVSSEGKEFNADKKINLGLSVIDDSDAEKNMILRMLSSLENFELQRKLEA